MLVIGTRRPMSAKMNRAASASQRREADAVRTEPVMIASDEMAASPPPSRSSRASERMDGDSAASCRDSVFTCGDNRL